MSNTRMMVVGKYHELKSDLRKKSLSVTAFRQRLSEEIDPIFKEFEEIDFEKVESFVGNLKTLQQEILNKAANKEELRAEAYELYVKKGMSIDTIFRILPEGAVSRKTLFNWKDSGEWDQARLKYFNRAKGFEETLWGLTEIYADAAKVNPDPQLAYSISSLISALLNNQKLAINIKNEATPEEGTTQKKGSGISPETVAAIRELLGAQ